MTIRQIIIIQLIFFSFKIFGQTSTKHTTSHSYDITYGHYIYTDKNNKPFNTIDNFNFTNPISFIGLGASNGAIPLDIKKAKTPIYFAGNMNLRFILPSKIKIDTLSFKPSGISLNLGHGKSIHSKDHHYNLIGYLGFNTGRLLLKSNEFGKQQQFFFIPKIGIQPKVIFGAFAISILSEYQLDVFKSTWRNSNYKKDNKFPLKTYNQSAMTFALCIGYHVHY